MQSQNLTSSQFADKLGVQRSGLSHILSGRNKPSLDFVLKVLAGFPDLNPQWLLQGKGKMYVNMAGSEAPLIGALPTSGTRPADAFFGAAPSLENPAPATSSPEISPVGDSPVEAFSPYDNDEEIFTAQTASQAALFANLSVGSAENPAAANLLTDPAADNTPAPSAPGNAKGIARIVLFYNDGTFAEFQPEALRPNAD